MSIFSGSYACDDVEFLLRPIQLKMTSVEDKEKLIQSGKAHYSDMLSQEPEPSPEHLNIYEDALENSATRLAKEVMVLAVRLSQEFQGKPIVLASLVRAGVPLGVMLKRALTHLGHLAFHYGISIVRDRGIDEKALCEIEKRHGAQEIVFVDGWTGKGAIATQLLACLAGRKGHPPLPRLVVLADLCGMSWLSASQEDWLIPFGILGAPVSGLISRSVWSFDDYHGCVICDHLKSYECSTRLVDHISQLQKNMDIEDIKKIAQTLSLTPDLINTTSHPLKIQSEAVISNLQDTFNVEKINNIKPGIAEATRAVLRRLPEHVLVSDIDDPDVLLLVHLAAKKGIQIKEVGSVLGQYRAATIIKKEI